MPERMSSYRVPMLCEEVETRGTDRITASVDLEQVGHRALDALAMLFSTTNGLTFAISPEWTCRPRCRWIPRFDSGPDDARRSLGLHLGIGKPGVADGIERREATVLGGFRNHGRSLSGWTSARTSLRRP